jgi:hypothetical protein
VVQVEKVERKQLLALKELGYGEGSFVIDSMHKREMTTRTKELRLIDKLQAQKIAESVGGELVDLNIDSATEWAIMISPIKALKIYFLLQKYSPEFEDEVVVLYGVETKTLGIPVDDLYDFTRLCGNALVRSARKLIEGSQTIE